MHSPQQQQQQQLAAAAGCGVLGRVLLGQVGPAERREMFQVSCLRLQQLLTTKSIPTDAAVAAAGHALGSSSVSVHTLHTAARCAQAVLCGFAAPHL
jgi:hypothetical protein